MKLIPEGGEKRKGRKKCIVILGKEAFLFVSPTSSSSLILKHFIYGFFDIMTCLPGFESCLVIRYFLKMNLQFCIQQEPLNVIPLGQKSSDYINRIITVNRNFYSVFITMYYSLFFTKCEYDYRKWLITLSMSTFTGFHCSFRSTSFIFISVLKEREIFVFKE